MRTITRLSASKLMGKLAQNIYPADFNTFLLSYMLLILASGSVLQRWILSLYFLHFCFLIPINFWIKLLSLWMPVVTSELPSRVTPYTVECVATVQMWWLFTNRLSSRKKCNWCVETFLLIIATCSLIKSQESNRTSKLHTRSD